MFNQRQQLRNEVTKLKKICMQHRQVNKHD